MASDTEQHSADTSPSSLDDASSRRLPPATPVFANPFLTPFLPQAMPQVDATNPGGYFLSASQYQELMQHYLHSLATAAAVAAKDEIASSNERVSGDAVSTAVTATAAIADSRAEKDGHARTPESESASVKHVGGEEEPRIDQRMNHEATTSVHSEEAASNAFSVNHSIPGDDTTKEESRSTESHVMTDTANNRTTVLIKKQMNEIEKEISRRSQNKNIKKIDETEVAQLLQGAHTQAPPDQAALPYTAYAESIAASGNAAIPVTNATLYHAHFPQQQQTPVMMMPPFLAQSVPAPMMPAVLMPSQPFVTPEMAAALLQQWQQSVAAVPTRVEEASMPTRTTVPDAANDTATWPGEGAWQETSKSLGEEKEPARESDEPVWVMRESYVNRLQREKDRANELNREQHNGHTTEQVPECSAFNDDEDEVETDKLLTREEKRNCEEGKKKSSKKEVMVHEPAVLIEGVLFRARYLGSTQLICDGRPSKASRMMQAQEAVARVKAPDGEVQPSTDIDLFISTEKIMVLNTDLQRISDTDVRQDILMDHALRSISYIADIGDVVVLMARRMSASSSEEECNENGIDTIRRTPRIICHVFESEEASFIAQSIGQAFQVAYVEFLRANGIDDPNYLREIDYQEVLNSQELMGEELEMFARKETQKDVVVPKKAGEVLGVQVVESGWGSMLPTVVIAKMAVGGAAARCNLLNIGDQVIAINGISLVGLPLATAQQNIKNAKSSTAVKLTVVSTPPVVEVRIKRPDTKYQLGFSVQNGVICSLLRGGIAERGGIRVGHRIIEINGMSVVAVAHERIVNMLATAIGEIHMKTMPTSVYRLMTGQETPNFI